MADRAKYVFTVKEYAPTGEGDFAQPWVMAEPVDGNLELLKDGFFGFELPGGTTYERASEIARFMNENLKEVSYTQRR